MESIIIKCPHCSDYIIIKKINCGIFRHGVLISNGKQINSHSNKKICDNYIKKKKIYGCGKPYQIIKEEETYKAIICDYI
jgi:DNA-binding sugar fermentation-stimulating protein